MDKRVPITEEQKKLSYAKYYDKPIAPVPPEKLEYLEKPKKALSLEPDFGPDIIF